MRAGDVIELVLVEEGAVVAVLESRRVVAVASDTKLSVARPFVLAATSAHYRVSPSERKASHSDNSICQMFSSKKIASKDDVKDLTYPFW